MHYLKIVYTPPRELVTSKERAGFATTSTSPLKFQVTKEKEMTSKKDI